ncbi:MAG: DUF2892 domain-containing protein [Myxococcales bacterium]|nr:MAG: DUF2892 domain-containing protein [Myxococcales bacterium]
MFFLKNVPTWERVLRVVAALAATVAALRVLAPPSAWLVASAAIGFALTGLFGVCPACALVGRRLPKQG